ncbi:PSP1 domain-containing protein [Guggenheimella bovis]
MKSVIRVRFQKAGKLYYFDSLELPVQSGDHVIVETVRGVEYGEVIGEARQIEEEELKFPLKPVIRIATPDDDLKHKENLLKEESAYKIGLEKIKEHGLDMSLLKTEYTFDTKKLVFYFSSEGRVDFRELVKDLAMIFHTRIELRQIGVRDEAKIISGVATCGRELCCASWLGEFQPVSIKMAKDQNLSLNPTKISGICGRLMCCLNFEEEAYLDLRRKLPKIGSAVRVDGKPCGVVDLNLLRDMVLVKMPGDDDTFENKWVPGAIIRGEEYEEPVKAHEDEEYELEGTFIEFEEEEKPKRRPHRNFQRRRPRK